MERARATAAMSTKPATQASKAKVAAQLVQISRAWNQNWKEYTPWDLVAVLERVAEKYGGFVTIKSGILFKSPNTMKAFISHLIAAYKTLPGGGMAWAELPNGQTYGNPAQSDP